jgi:hypothetical protein
VKFFGLVRYARSTMGNVALNHEKRRFASFSRGKIAASAFAYPTRFG